MRRWGATGLLALALFAGCPSTSLRSTLVPGLAAWTEGRLNTTQTCQRAPELLACAERQALYLFGKAVERGHAASVEAVRRAWGHPMLCLVEHQEPCCLGDICAQSSTAAASRLPRAGCTIYNATWIARRSAEGLPYDYSALLFTELLTSTAATLGLPLTPQHSTPWESQPFPGGALACDWRR